MHTNASLVAIGAMLVQSLARKHNHLIDYAYILLNSAKRNYSTTKRAALIMVFALHKFKHYLLGNKFVFYVNHMALVYIVNKP